MDDTPYEKRTFSRLPTAALPASGQWVEGNTFLSACMMQAPLMDKYSTRGI